MRRHFLPALDSHLYLESFFVSVVCGLLGVRFYLYVTGFPQVGGRGLHVAHMLWGGALMVIGIVFLLAYFGRFARRLSAILAGAGFGIFIDELGKFLTSNNNYFFKPAAAIIYLVFMLLFAGMYLVLRRRHETPGMQLILTLQAFVEAVAQDFDQAAVQRVRSHIHGCEEKSQIVEAVEAVLHDIRTHNPGPPGPIRRLALTLDRLYLRCINLPAFQRGVAIAFTAWAAVHTVTDAVSLAGPIRQRSITGDLSLSMASGAVAVLTLVAALLVLAGDVQMFRSRMAAYQLYKYAMLVVIFFTTDIQFYRVQFFALVGLAQAVTGLLVVNAFIHREVRHRHMHATIPSKAGLGAASGGAAAE